jgi:elongation factor Tu
MNQPLLIVIEAVFKIKQRGIVAVGRILQGVLRKGDPIEVVGIREQSTLSAVVGIAIINRPPEQIDDKKIIMLRDAYDVEPGMVIATPGTVTAIKQFMANVQIIQGEASPQQLDVSIDVTDPNAHKLSFYGREFACTVIGIESLLSDSNQPSRVTIALPVPLVFKISWKFRIKLKSDPDLVGIGEIVELN